MTGAASAGAIGDAFIGGTSGALGAAFMALLLP